MKYSIVFVRPCPVKRCCVAYNVTGMVEYALVRSNQLRIGMLCLSCPFFVCVRSDQILPRDVVVRKRPRTYAARHREPSNRNSFPAKSQTRPASHNTDYQIQDFVLQHNVGVFHRHDRCPKRFNSKFEFWQKWI